jgi:hypothetical protein
MTDATFQADYLVVGAGAMGMAFTDTLVTESDASVILVDRYHQPGGHWNVAYPYVRLHQPSAFYGVNSRKLGSDVIDTKGWNAGLYELATNSEVCAYFDQVMQQQFIPSQRVQYFPMCEYEGHGTFRSLVSGEVHQASVSKVVDATYMHVTVPAMREPPYTVADGVASAAPNALPKLAGDFDDFVVVGAGKTGMDACLFLLRNGLAPERISWIMPRDSWLLDRANIQPGELFASSIGRGFTRQLEAIAGATSIDDLFQRVEASGQLLRFDPDTKPTMYRCATVTVAELEQLRRIPNIVRKGRVKHIALETIVLDHGNEPTSARTLHVDCSADGLERRPATPVFNGGDITLQSVRTCQQVFSASLIAHVEVNYYSDAEKNALCAPVPHPDSDIDFLRTSLANALNAAQWGEDIELQRWLHNARLDGFTQADGQPDLTDPATQERLAQTAALAAASTSKLQQLLHEHEVNAD